MMFQLHESNILATSMRAKMSLGQMKAEKGDPRPGVNASLMCGVRGQEGKGPDPGLGRQRLDQSRERHVSIIYVFHPRVHMALSTIWPH